MVAAEIDILIFFDLFSSQKMASISSMFLLSLIFGPIFRVILIMSIILRVRAIGFLSLKISKKTRGFCSKIILIIVDCFYIETSGVIRLESWEATFGLDLEGASFTLGQSDINDLLLADRVKGEGCVVTAAALSEGAHGLG